MRLHTSLDKPKMGSPAFMEARAHFFAEHLFREEIYGPNASVYIADFCKKARAQLKLYSENAQRGYSENERALINLAGRVKYILAHIDLAECYGKQLGIMTENDHFRQQAVSYISMIQAGNEALEYFSYED